VVKKNKLLECFQTFKELRTSIHALDIELFLKQLATLIAAGIPLIHCLNLLENAQEKYQFRLLIYYIKKEMLSGKSLFESLSMHSHHFDNIICHLIKIGEQTGKLEELLNKASYYQEKNNFLRQQFKQALFYPSLIILTALSVTMCLLLFVIPKFADLFMGSEQSLPALTLAIFHLSHFLQEKGRYFLTFNFITLSIILYYRDKVKFYLFHFLFSLPFFKSLLKKIILARFASNLAIMFASGIPIVKALELAMNISSEREFILKINEIKAKITAGCSLNECMKSLNYFPVLMIQMIQIGEETGMLEIMLHKTADFLEKDIQAFLQYAGKLLEPLIMIILGVLIGGLIIGMYLPIFKLGSLL